MTRINLPTKANEDCPTCRTTHILTIEHDEDGWYVQIDLTPCGDDNCTKKLCSACPQFNCDCCGLKFCEEHRCSFYSPVSTVTESLCGECCAIYKQDDPAYSVGANTGAGSTHTPSTK